MMYIWPVWLNGWVSVYELNGCQFESRSCHLNILAHKLLQNTTNTVVFKGNWGEELTTLIWKNLVIRTIQLESREMHLSLLEIWKKNTTKEIPGLNYLTRLFEKKKCIKLFLKYFHAFFPSPISEKGKDETSRKFGKGTTDLKKKKKDTKMGEERKNKNLEGWFSHF